MIVFPNCKINIGLHILRKRQDNYHDLETVFYPLELQDALEIIQKDQDINNEFQITGLPIDSKIEDNICLKAYNLLKSDFPSLPAVRFHLHKVIPSGAGLGGGSADGAFTLLTINKKFNLGLSEKELISYALQLGSDCPFFIKNAPCYATSRGEVMQEVNLDLSTYKIIVVNPRIHVNTAWAFTRIKPHQRAQQILSIIRNPITDWKNLITNDFEVPVFQDFPEIKKIKDHFYNHDALYASMSGSGSTVYGIFEKNTTLPLPFPCHYFIKSF
jgi:4-diphosphocytidyl-2-C-methyl-D-erythritol kinase